MNIDKSILIDFLKNYAIPIYIIGITNYQKLYDFFIKGEGLEYINLYEADTIIYNNENYKNNVFKIFKLNFDKNSEIEEVNPIENMIKNMSKEKLNKIKIKSNYKTILCKYYQDYKCWDGDNCNYAHGRDELKLIKNIRNYLNNKDEKQEKLKLYKKKCNKVYNEIKDEAKNIFTIFTIKLIKRIIFEMLYSNNIKEIEIEKLWNDIIYIYESLCLEYYFNCKNNIYTNALKEKLLNYFKKSAIKKDIEFSENIWILHLFKQIEKIDYNQQIFNFNELNLKNNEQKLLDKLCYSPNIIYDKLLFIIEIIKKEYNNELFIKYYFYIINSALNNIIKNIEVINNNIYNTGDNYECLILSKVMDIILNYYYNKLTDKDKGSINPNIIIEKSEFPFSVIDEVIKKLITINLDEYFPPNDNEGGNQIKKMTQQTSVLIEFIFKYFDLCLILFYKENQTKFFDYMINHENKLFKYYHDYKILTMEKNNINKDFEETAAFIYYLIEIIYSNNILNNGEKYIDEILMITPNQFNEYKFKYKCDIYDIIFEKKDNMNYNKIAIFSFDEKIKQLYFQDIVDFDDYFIYDNTYKLRTNKNILLIPLKNINTFLYSIENNIQSLQEERNNIINTLNTFTKYENVPKYSWNIGYDGNKYLLLSEADNQVYSFYESKKYSELIKLDCIIDKRINIINKKDNKIIYFFNSVENCSSFAVREKGEIHLLDENRKRYYWLNGRKKNEIEYPILINDVKLIYISANCNECYVIGNNGNLYEKKGSNFKKIKPPENFCTFIQCVCGNGYVICLVKNNQGKGIIYAKGVNDKCQYGIKKRKIMEENIKQLTKLNLDDKLDFKYICTYKGFSAALTSCGKLYVWGLKFESDYSLKLIETPLLINKNNSIIIDKISLNLGFLYGIGRKLEKGNYIKNIFLLEDNVSFKEENCPFILKEIKLTDKENSNSEIIPVKILIGLNRTYLLCINQNELIQNYFQNDYQNEIINKQKLFIRYSIKDAKIEHNLESLRNIYDSNKLNKFIYLFNLFSDKNKEDLIKAFEEMTRKNIKLINVEYNDLIKYLEGKVELKDLLLFFLSNEKNEGKVLFNYLKTRILLVEKNIRNYLNINNSLNSEGIFQKIIDQNISYLNDDFRVQYFLTILINMIEPNKNKRKITIDRIKTLNFKEEYNDSKKPDIYLTETIFGQLFHSLNDLEGKQFLLEKGEKLFKVDLKGEGAIDEGGPYSEIISNICDELQSDYVELFIKTANNKYNIGDLRERYIVNPNSNNIIYKKAFEFIGKLMALSISSGETLNLNLHPIVWKCLLEKKITFKEYETIDKNFYNLIEKLKEGLLKKDKNLIESFDLYFEIQILNEKEVELIDNGKNIKVTLENVELFIELAQSIIIDEINNIIKFIKVGLNSVIEKNILQILKWEQLEEMVCGDVIFNMKEFKNNTIYDNKEKVIQWFWEWLENCKEEDKFKYLKFVSGRSRLPKSKYEHKINIVFDKNLYPSSHTCFSTLYLPKYDSRDILFERMKYVIYNITNITDN